jgi:hypothetical protein
MTMRWIWLVPSQICRRRLSSYAWSESGAGAVHELGRGSPA